MTISESHQGIWSPPVKKFPTDSKKFPILASIGFSLDETIQDVRCAAGIERNKRCRVGFKKQTNIGLEASVLNTMFKTQTLGVVW